MNNDTDCMYSVNHYSTTTITLVTNPHHTVKTESQGAEKYNGLHLFVKKVDESGCTVQDVF